MREITQLKNAPPEGIRVQTSEDNMLDLTGIIEGPEGTPYAGGYFRVKFTFTEEFPAAPPKCWFATKIFHPNVSNAGEICVNTLKKDWKSTYGIEHILVTVKCLLIYPNPESALDEEAGKLLLEDYGSYCSRARLITSVHATPRFPRTRPLHLRTDNTRRISSTRPHAHIHPPHHHPQILLPRPAAAPHAHAHAAPLPLKTSPGPNAALLGGGENDGAGTLAPASLSKDQARHISPSPLGTADANVSLPAAPFPASSAPTPGTKAVKRAATGAATSGAEKRKKALKRL
ncbi:ubiquitin-conjugating enzyme/RWD-like protein [Mycena rosella]|uniref:E2 ubiquitin-conjugating enzyme n=1 Tax=Mycena rosella TaxID=1033263 RepID=A0AAD7DFY8_MYCRO|nr:ubiquitin-conjugating enzyme/RWD-like protein [Mycena rosella]